MKINSKSSFETKSLGRNFSKILKKQDIVLLEGELGGGKTTFVKGVARGLGYKGKVLSPSYTLVRRYKVSKLTINHIDLYRLDKKSLGSIDMQEYLYNKNTISIVEWGQKLESYLDKYLIVKFSFLEMEKRELSFSQKGYNKNRLKGFVK
ncbi:MAG: tRNA (adenosine(37)-N6)-threonylcarbamoyltransferase complex ATPase subunit type 1 TsaE [Candidatus Omnitrophica bacterium]|nr:tRNA (adenosine(37)-N6)-threonylcarbamoyltransferase complex ATPase subunit type 1 TsaE [Candidatus Omnitrophota bacterium]MCF7893928.1 tRNA (adenosine(37)-N6)-threonylcarbamoyltransferase complex ATPase subunit type 1 TsaE [Candidatus Omnitrophota bacterium]